MQIKSEKSTLFAHLQKVSRSSEGGSMTCRVAAELKMRVYFSCRLAFNQKIFVVKEMTYTDCPSGKFTN